MVREILARVVANKKLKKDGMLLTITLPSAFSNPLPGQFVMLRPASNFEANAPFLPRPFSICSFENGQIEILYRVVGRGTAWLAGLGAGANLFIRGPLGNSFIVTPEIKRAILIAGGAGIAPLLFFASQYRNTLAEIQFLFGSRCEDELFLAERLDKLCDVCEISTDDGSCGVCGTVTSLLPDELSAKDTQGLAIYACGPKKMLASLAAMLPLDVPCFVSLEEHMACGLGACLGCSVKTNGTNGQQTMRRVCKDGPIFDIHQITWL